MHIEINQDNAVFVVLSFEGPDVYSQAGGLGVRVTNLAQTLAHAGYSTHLFFVGDPKMKGEETQIGGKLVLHRWCQWISAYHPLGCYQGEREKLADYTRSIPEWVINNIVRPAAARQKFTIILAEEWQTAAVMVRMHEELIRFGLRNDAISFWNANNTFGFDQIDFKRLSRSCTITTVSRYMKHIMWQMGLNPVVIPNGIPSTLLEPVDLRASARLRQSLSADLVLAKIARWDPDKRWNMALAATAGLKSKGFKIKMVARGGMEGYGEEVLQTARSLGLVVEDVYAKWQTTEGFISALEASASRADVLNLKFYCPQDFLRLVYNAADAVLANSGREPFGLVGLETMASGGVAFTGSTGEEYAVPFHNAIILETENPKEIDSYVTYLYRHPEESLRIRKAARTTAAQYTWEQVIENLIQRLEFQAAVQNTRISSPQSRLSQSLNELLDRHTV